MTDKIETSVEFWEYIIKKRNFDENGYDLDATNYIKKELDLLSGRTILGGLESKEKKSTPIELEAFIKVFFESMQPFSDMMVDLLCMFEEIAVKKTNKNLNIKFDFDKGKMPHTISLNHFKETTSIWSDINSEYEIPVFNVGTYWQLLKSIKIQDEVKLKNNSVNSWLDSYEKDGTFTSSFLNFNIEENGVLGVLFLIWKSFVIELKNKYMNKESIRNSDSEIYSLVSNKWVENMLKALSYLSEDGNIARRQKIEKELVDFCKEVSIRKLTAKEKIKKLEEYLKLPFWDKRYELYSVWIFSLIYEAIKDYGLIVHTVDGALVFPFKETHLATLPCKNGNILIFSEKKTKLINPVGKSRTKHIQPDYSFYKEPITDTKSSILEIECKQYKKQGTDNFARALIDYSNGRENADVYLVNYGLVNKDRVFHKIDEFTVDTIKNNKERCDIIGQLKPKSNVDIFMKIIKEKVLTL